jgi:hypothetical protein
VLDSGFETVVGIGDRPDWRLRRKHRRLGRRYRAGLLTAVTALMALPYGEELVRCARADRRRQR